MHKKFVCIHGHFYQPPRENPYTELIPKQDSASPFHDWNHKINYECYGPNAFSRVLNRNGQIIKIINNYQYISFNFGPTLINWLKENATKTYRGILDADKKSVQLYNGHGSAIAQVYNHVIMPFASRDDKEIQIKWAINDFQFHFQRYPEGMWLAETAVDTETLEVLAENDIKYTILSPHQADSIKMSWENDFSATNINSLNTNIPYIINLPSGNSIIVFFYNGTIAHDLSFGDLLKSGDELYVRLQKTLNMNSYDMELSTTALDGETFGHHHKQGDMALAYCIDKLSKDNAIKLCNYGCFLDYYTPIHEARIKERTAWSCAHGIERWNSNCSCRIQQNDWNQEWRGPLREALNFLNHQADAIFKELVTPYFKNYKQVLIEYIEVILDRNKDKTITFFEKRLGKKIDDATLTQLSRLFEMKRNSQLMFSSCGWFFDDISSIETTQILFYADRVFQIIFSIYDKDKHDNMLKKFLLFLRKAKSNIPELENGETVYKKFVLPNRLALSNVGMKHSFYMLFDDISPIKEEKNFTVFQNHEPIINQLGYQKILSCTIEVTSKVTFSKRYFHFVVLQVGRANILGYFYLKKDNLFIEEFKKIAKKLSLKNIPYLIKKLNSIFRNNYNLNSLNIEDKEVFLNQIMQKENEIVNLTLNDIYLRNYPLNYEYLLSNIKQPRYIRKVIEYVLSEKFIALLDSEPIMIADIEACQKDLILWNVNFKDLKVEFQEKARYSIRKKLKKLVKGEDKMDDIIRLTKVFKTLNLKINNWNNQNYYVDYLVKNKLDINSRIANSKEFSSQMEKLSLYLNIDYKSILTN